MDLRSACSIAIQLVRPPPHFSWPRFRIMEWSGLTHICIERTQMTRLEFMHSRGVLHRDIQLGNCVIGLEPRQETIYMIDFGFSKRYLDHKQRHIANRTESSFVGNYWFSSVNVHCRGKSAHALLQVRTCTVVLNGFSCPTEYIACSRRDDLESAALLLLHILTPGGLPWTRNGVPRDDAAHDRLKREKRAALPEDLAFGLPEEFEEFLRYCRGLAFAEQPDYAYWRGRFRDLADELGYKDADRFIWPPPPVPAVSVGYSRVKGYWKKLTLFKNQPTIRPLKPRSQSPEAHLAGLLRDLAQMNINKENPVRPVLGDKKNVQGQGDQNGRLVLKKPETDITIISDDEQQWGRGVPGPAEQRVTKATRITKLTKAAGQAVDNRVLAQITSDFVKVLQSSNSRTLTREGFAFLDVLHKQLADPSVFIVPLRTSKTRSSRSQRQEPTDLPAEEAVQERRSRLNVLRGSVAKAQDNKSLAKLITEFGTLIDKAAGRKLTKDGLAFLENMADRLLVVRV